MSEAWQNVIVLSVVALAVVYLAVRAAGVFRRKNAAGCGGGCSSCPSASEASASETKAPKLVSIELGSSGNGPKNGGRI